MHDYAIARMRDNAILGIREVRYRAMITRYRAI